MEIPSHVVGGGEFVDVDHVYIKEGFGWIDLIHLRIHGGFWRRDLKRRKMTALKEHGLVLIFS